MVGGWGWLIAIPIALAVILMQEWLGGQGFLKNRVANTITFTDGCQSCLVMINAADQHDLTNWPELCRLAEVGRSRSAI